MNTPQPGHFGLNRVTPDHATLLIQSKKGTEHHA